MASRSSPVERLRAFADESGLSQEGLAELLGCAQSHVSRIFSGEKGVGLKLGSAIERATRAWRGGQIHASDWEQPEHEAVR